jgi:hypothetical protein
MFLRNVATSFCGSVGLVLILLSMFQTSTKPTYAQTVPPPTATPVGTPVPEYSTNLYVSPSATTTVEGATLQVTLTVHTSLACPITIYDAALYQTAEIPLFTYVDPLTHTVGPPATNPVIFNLKAIRPGAAILSARAFAMIHCDFGTVLDNVRNTSATIHVTELPYKLYVPKVQKLGSSVLGHE